VERGAGHPIEWDDYLITPFEKVKCKFLKLCANFASFAPFRLKWKFFLPKSSLEFIFIERWSVCGECGVGEWNDGE
jgi:hypothetical protein